uniref:Uncharacterized protein n=1 Tax=Kalanchoe fedtschenkoi TaxID=63787 RepID=A0A7N0ZS47_KALFE
MMELDDFNLPTTMKVELWEQLDVSILLHAHNLNLAEYCLILGERRSYLRCGPYCSCAAILMIFITFVMIVRPFSSNTNI